MKLDHLKPFQQWILTEGNINYSLHEIYNLQGLNLSHKNLQWIHPDFKLLSNVKIFFCIGNKLERVNLENLNLQHLDLGDNNITQLELNCPNLKILYCYNNQLTKLELNCPNLQELYCYNNQLTKLELNCPNLKRLYCFNNPFLIKKDSLSHKLFAKFYFEDYNIMEESKLTELL